MDLFAESDRKMLAAFIEGEKHRLTFNEQIFTILEGNIKSLLEEKMKSDLGPESFQEAWTRETPVNVLRKIVDKQTRIYSREVVREVVGPNASEEDKALVNWYVEQLSLDTKMGANNENYNAFLYSLLQVGINNRKPYVRTIPNHHFLVFNHPDNPDPTAPDAIIICLGKYKDKAGLDRGMYAVYTDMQFIIMDSQAEILYEEMVRRDQDGFNPYGALPFTYVNASQNLIMPLTQQDNKDMTLLIPLLLTDLNYAVKFQCFSVFVAIDVEDSKIKISPNAILKLKSDPKGDKPSFEAIKPTVDITESLNLAASEMGLWLTTKGLRPSTVGTVGADTFASGVSKIIDESDAYESEKKQIRAYEKAEAEFWELLLRRIHPIWVAGNLVDNLHTLTEGSRVVTRFAKPVPMQTRGEMVAELNAEVIAGFLSRERAIRRLNPDMDDEEIQTLMTEIEANVI